MTDPEKINCVECQSQLIEFALDELPEQLRASIAEHLASGCAACNEQLSEVVAGFAKFAHALPAERPAARVEADLFKRIATQQRKLVGSPVAELQVAPVSTKTPTRRLAVAAVLLAASLAGIAVWSNWNADTKPRFAPGGQWAELQRRVSRANEVAPFSAMPELKFASVQKPSADSMVQGFVVVDQFAKQWHVYAFHLPAPSPGRRYQLWFDLGDSHFLAAGAADIDQEGALSHVVDLPKEVTDVKGLAISDEADESPERPSGENLLEAPLR